MNYNDNWDQHWENFNEATSFNPAQAYRRDMIINQIKKTIDAKTHILDIGSGQGDLLAELESVFPTATLSGVELSAIGVKISQQKVPVANFVQMDLLSQKIEIPLQLKNSADIAICSEVLEHLDNPLLFLQNTTKLLKNDAKLIITVPSGPRSAFDRHLGHRKHYQSAELKKILELAGLKVEQIFKAGFPFFNLYKMLLVLRGKRLIYDVKRTNLSFFAKLVMIAFSIFFKLNLNKSPWGWQLIAVAQLKNPQVCND